MERDCGLRPQSISEQRNSSGGFNIIATRQLSQSYKNARAGRPHDFSRKVPKGDEIYFCVHPECNWAKV